MGETMTGKSETEWVIFRDHHAVAITGNPLHWFHSHTPFSQMHAEAYEGYRVDEVASVRLCATCYRLTYSGHAVPVLVRTGDRENPATVHKHPDCAHPPRTYHRSPSRLVSDLLSKMRTWDASK